MSDATGGGRRLSDEYEMQGPVLRRANARAGLPSIRAAIHKANDDTVLLKSWPRRQGVDDGELGDIWRNELRQLQRLMSYPKARDRLALLYDSSELEDGFHLMLGSEQREPLEVRLLRATKADWFFSLRDDRNRLRLWQEIQRISEGLEILHSQGLLHRNIDAWSVLTSVGEDPDFILTGFEWSIRLTSGVAPKGRRRPGAFQTLRYSFYEDWKAVGVLAARLLGFRSNARPDEPYFPDIAQPAETLTSLERDLLVLLLGADPLARLDAQIVLEQLGRIQGDLRARLVGREPRLVLAIGIGPQSRLSASISDATSGDVEAEDREAQIRFVEQDLSEGPRLIKLKPRDNIDPPRYILRGRHLNYRLQQFVPPKGSATWSVARCSEVAFADPAYAAIELEQKLDGYRLEIITVSRAAATYQQNVGRTSKWDDLFAVADDDPVGASDPTYGALALLQVLDGLSQAAEMWPVTMIHSSPESSDTRILLVSRLDDVIDRLSDSLGLKKSAVRLSTLFNSDNPVLDGGWRLLDEPHMGAGRDRGDQWRFVDLLRDGQREVYVFEGSGAPPTAVNLYLRAGGSGTDRLLQRRLKALKALRDHAELLDMLAKPRNRRRPSQEPWTSADAPRDLDEPKAAAMGEMWSVLPLYLLQGPPGVGKTKLVEELVAKRINANSAERFLLTAQSHSAVDHLLVKVAEAIQRGRPAEEADSVMALRCRRLNHASGSSPWDLPIQASALAMRLRGSTMVGNAPSRLRARVDRLVASSIPLPARKRKADDRIETGDPDRSFASLLLRSSNLVFASTNARELEILIDERAQFDWSIIEEAAKATGTDLLAPLLLSHRRLMIGDHMQLPPFGTKEMMALLAAPDKISKALETGRHLIARSFGLAGVEDALDLVASADVESLVPHARSLFLMFESMVLDELKPRQNAQGLRTFRRLNLQHRMHPAIAKLVAAAFYDDDLDTSDEAKSKFKENPPFEWVEGSLLPECPVVFVDIPHAHANKGQQTPEGPPRYRNAGEADEVVRVLGSLRAREGRRPTVAVLTPYRSQVALLRDRIEAARSDGLLPALEGFDTVASSLCHTVDSFQGNEADIVILSLVRNNAHSGEKSLGFLSDSRRMNVLMSRAKWRMVLVGSLEFLRARFAADVPEPELDKLAFLRRWLKAFDELRIAGPDGDAQVVPATLLSGNPL